MPRYAPRTIPVRKDEILAKREAVLLHVLKNNGSDAKHIKAAEEVRYAHLKCCKARLAILNQKDSTQQTQAAISNAIADEEYWRELSSEEIIVKYAQGVT